MQVAGVIICVLVSIRLVQSILLAQKIHWSKSKFADKSLELFQSQIAANKALRVQREDQQLQWNGYRKFKVARKILEAEGTTSLYLVPHDKRRLQGFRPGQFLTFRFHIAGGKNAESKPVVRCYSLSDAPHDEYFRVTVKRVPPPRGTDHPAGCASNYINDDVRVGDLLDVQAPRGDFALDPHGTNPVVLIGGGVGVTPVLSMLNAIVKAESSRDVWFFYGVRNGADHVMRDHLRGIAEANPNVRLIVCYSEPTAADISSQCFDRQGRVDIALIREILKVTNFDFYICGPGPMMDSLVPALQDWGVPKERVHSEAFGPAAVKKPAAAAPTAAKASQASKISVKFARSDKTVPWSEAADNLLNLASENGISIDSGCRAGSCGTCVVAVREGATQCTVDVDCPEGSCLACVSVPVGDLTLDA